MISIYLNPKISISTIYLTGNGNFSSSNDGTMDLTFSEPNLPGQIECSILLTKLD